MGVRWKVPLGDWRAARLKGQRDVRARVCTKVRGGVQTDVRSKVQRCVTKAVALGTLAAVA